MNGVYHPSLTPFLIPCSKPLGAALSFRIFQGMFLVMTTFFAYRTVQSIGAAQGGGAFRAAALRFHILARRGSVLTNLSAPALSAFGPLVAGCPLSPILGSVRASSTALMWGEDEAKLALGTEVIADGYFFVTGYGDPALDPVRWEVQAARADEAVAGSWYAVGASAWRTDDKAAIQLLPQLAFATPSARGARVDVDMRLGWPDVVWTCVDSGFWSFISLCIAVAGAAGHEWAVRPLFGLAVLVDSVLTAVSAIGLAEMGDWRATATRALVLIPSLLLLVGVLVYEARIVTAFAVFACAFITTAFFSDMEIYANAVSPANAVPSSAIVALLISFLIVAFRRRTLMRARNLILQDQAQYDRLWAELAASPSTREQLLSIREQAEVLNKGLPTVPPRQHNRTPEVPMGDGIGEDANPMVSASGVASFAGPVGKVDSLEQLFTQAACLQPLLVEKVQTWALASGGCFPVQGSLHKFLRYADAVAAGTDAPPLKFATIKSVGRAVEKVVRAYGQVSVFLSLLSRASDSDVVE